MKSLRILLGCAHAPLPEGSAASRWYCALIHGLAVRGHRVTVLAACESAAEARVASDCFSAPNCDLKCFTMPQRKGIASRVETLLRPHSYLFSREMIRQWRAECASGHDIRHLEETFTGWLGRSSEPHRTILNIHNLYSIDWAMDPSLSQRVRILRSLTVRTERKLIRSFPNLLTVSSALAREVARIAPHSTVKVVPLALNLNHYDFVPPAKRPRYPVVAMIGSMDWPSSKCAAERLLVRLWPTIRKEFPNARLQITGKRARNALRAYLNVPGADFHEDVVSTQPYFENATLLLYAPERGSGMKVKVLEAFAYGLPVVTTPSGIEGLEVEDGVHAGIQETDEGLIERALGLLSDPARQEAQRRAARHLLETKYSADAAIERLENVYAGVLRGSLTRADDADPALSEQYANHR